MEAIDGSDKRFIVTKPDGQTYRVLLVSEDSCGPRGTCDRPFNGDGWNHHTCKHIAFVRDNVDALRALELRPLFAELVQGQSGSIAIFQNVV